MRGWKKRRERTERKIAKGKKKAVERKKMEANRKAELRI